MIGHMELATCPPGPRAPVRGDERARRLGQVKFMVLEVPAAPEPVPPTESLSSSPAKPYRALRAFLSRVLGRLVAARP